MRPVLKFAAAAALGSLALAGCGSKPSSSSTGGATAAAGGTSGGATLKACMVLDTGGVDDRSFNQSSWQGMKDAHKANPNIKIKYVPSSSNSDYIPNLKKMAGQKCDPVIAVGGLMQSSIKKIAPKYKGTHFAEIDASSVAKNDYGIQFNTAQAAFLAGYLAAGMSKSGTVGTWGGLPIPPVTIYMDGFVEGVNYYNKQKNKSVKVLGWNEKSQKGTFSSSFTDQNKGKSITSSMVSQGADIVFPVAGGAGLGAGAAAQAANGKLNLIWVDTDGCVSASQYCKYIITSATKNLAGGVKKYLNQAVDGTIPTGNYVGSLKDNGVGLAPYHQFDSKVPASLKKEIKQVRADIVSGKIKIKSPSQPKAG